MDRIFSSLIYYNANSRDARVGDCVKRGLSVAYSMDYDEVSKELNQIKRSLNLSVFNDSRVFNVFVRRRRDKFVGLHSSEYVTVSEFAEEHPSGVYVLLAGKNNTNPSSTHLLALVDGNVYDSWDSLNYYVKQYAKVSGGNSDTYEFDGQSIADEICHEVVEYVETRVVPKLPECMIFKNETAMDRVNKYTYELIFFCQFQDVPEGLRYKYRNLKYGHTITVKFNPRLSEEENFSVCVKKCKQKVYDWLYNIRKEIQDEIESQTIVTHRKFRGDKKDLLKLPEWVRPLVTWLSFEDNYSNKYPRYNKNNQVSFRADTIRELRDELEYYRTDYSRIDYDY